MADIPQSLKDCVCDVVSYYWLGGDHVHYMGVIGESIDAKVDTLYTNKAWARLEVLDVAAEAERWKQQFVDLEFYDEPSVESSSAFVEASAALRSEDAANIWNQFIALLNALDASKETPVAYRIALKKFWRLFLQVLLQYNQDEWKRTLRPNMVRTGRSDIENLEEDLNVYFYNLYTAENQRNVDILQDIVNALRMEEDRVVQVWIERWQRGDEFQLGESDPLDEDVASSEEADVLEEQNPERAEYDFDVPSMEEMEQEEYIDTLSEGEEIEEEERREDEEEEEEEREDEEEEEEEGEKSEDEEEDEEEGEKSEDVSKQPKRRGRPPSDDWLDYYVGKPHGGDALHVLSSTPANQLNTARRKTKQPKPKFAYRKLLLDLMRRPNGPQKTKRSFGDTTAIPSDGVDYRGKSVLHGEIIPLDLFRILMNNSLISTHECRRLFVQYEWNRVFARMTEAEVFSARFTKQTVVQGEAWATGFYSPVPFSFLPKGVVPIACLPAIEASLGSSRWNLTIEPTPTKEQILDLMTQITAHGMHLLHRLGWLTFLMRWTQSSTLEALACYFEDAVDKNLLSVNVLEADELRDIVRAAVRLLFGSLSNLDEVYNANVFTVYTTEDGTELEIPQDTLTSMYCLWRYILLGANRTTRRRWVLYDHKLLTTEGNMARQAEMIVEEADRLHEAYEPVIAELEDERIFDPREQARAILQEVTAEAEGWAKYTCISTMHVQSRFLIAIRDRWGNQYSRPVYLSRKKGRKAKGGPPAPEILSAMCHDTFLRGSKMGDRYNSIQNDTSVRDYLTFRPYQERDFTKTHEDSKPLFKVDCPRRNPGSGVLGYPDLSEFLRYVMMHQEEEETHEDVPWGTHPLRHEIEAFSRYAQSVYRTRPADHPKNKYDLWKMPASKTTQDKIDIASEVQMVYDMHMMCSMVIARQNKDVCHPDTAADAYDFGVRDGGRHRWLTDPDTGMLNTHTGVCIRLTHILNEKLADDEAPMIDKFVADAIFMFMQSKVGEYAAMHKSTPYFTWLNATDRDEVATTAKADDDKPAAKKKRKTQKVPSREEVAARKAEEADRGEIQTDLDKQNLAKIGGYSGYMPQTLNPPYVPRNVFYVYVPPPSRKGKKRIYRAAQPATQPTNHSWYKGAMEDRLQATPPLPSFSKPNKTRFKQDVIGERAYINSFGTWRRGDALPTTLVYLMAAYSQLNRESDDVKCNWVDDFRMGVYKEKSSVLIPTDETDPENVAVYTLRNAWPGDDTNYRVNEYFCTTTDDERMQVDDMYVDPNSMPLGEDGFLEHYGKMYANSVLRLNHIRKDGDQDDVNSNRDDDINRILQKSARRVAQMLREEPSLWEWQLRWHYIVYHLDVHRREKNQSGIDLRSLFYANGCNWMLGVYKRSRGPMYFMKSDSPIENIQRNFPAGETRKELYPMVRVHHIHQLYGISPIGASAYYLMQYTKPSSVMYTEYADYHMQYQRRLLFSITKGGVLEKQPIDANRTRYAMPYFTFERNNDSQKWILPPTFQRVNGGSSVRFTHEGMSYEVDDVDNVLANLDPPENSRLVKDVFALPILTPERIRPTVPVVAQGVLAQYNMWPIYIRRGASEEDHYRKELQLRKEEEEDRRKQRNPPAKKRPRNSFLMILANRAWTRDHSEEEYPVRGTPSNYRYINSGMSWPLFSIQNLDTPDSWQSVFVDLRLVRYLSGMYSPQAGKNGKDFFHVDMIPRAYTNKHEYWMTLFESNNRRYTEHFSEIDDSRMPMKAYTQHNRRVRLNSWLPAVPNTRYGPPLWSNKRKVWSVKKKDQRTGIYMEGISNMRLASDSHHHYLQTLGRTFITDEDGLLYSEAFGSTSHIDRGRALWPLQAHMFLFRTIREFVNAPREQSAERQDATPDMRSPELNDGLPGGLTLSQLAEWFADDSQSMPNPTPDDEVDEVPTLSQFDEFLPKDQSPEGDEVRDIIGDAGFEISDAEPIVQIAHGIESDVPTTYSFLVSLDDITPAEELTEEQTAEFDRLLYEEDAPAQSDIESAFAKLTLPSMTRVPLKKNREDYEFVWNEDASLVQPDDTVFNLPPWTIYDYMWDVNFSVFDRKDETEDFHERNYIHKINELLKAVRGVFRTRINFLPKGAGPTWMGEEHPLLAGIKRLAIMPVDIRDVAPEYRGTAHLLQKLMEPFNTVTEALRIRRIYRVWLVYWRSIYSYNDFVDMLNLLPPDDVSSQ